MSVVASYRRQLEDRGDLVACNNAASGWFAVNPNTLARRQVQARNDGREDFNLVVYKTQTSDPRDHYVLPYAIVRPLLTEQTKHPMKNGLADRWDLTLKDGMLHVTHGSSAHGSSDIDVSAYRGALLLTEAPTPTDDLMEPTADPETLERRVRALRAMPLERPTGSPVPRRIATATQTAFERRPDVKAWVLRAAAGICELCRSPAPFVAGDGHPYLELHHVHRLADGGSDTVENAVGVCPNCHRVLHHGAEREARRELLRRQVARLRP